jgi:hypothetical protein
LNQIKSVANEFLIILIWAALGLIGGVVRYLEDRCTTRISWKRMLASLCTSAFAGGLVGAFMHNYILDPRVLGAACAIGGYSGQLTLLLAMGLLKKKLGKEI